MEKKMKKLSKYIDHTLLKADATAEQIETLCQQAKQYDFASVCVNGGFVKKCSELLKDTDVKVCCVVGFPLGAMDSKSKADETRNCVANGAKEIDMVINISAAKDHNWQFVQDDIAAVVEAANGNTVKVIIETCLLTDEEKVEACKCAVRAKAEDKVFNQIAAWQHTGEITKNTIVALGGCVGSELAEKILDLNNQVLK